MIIVTTMPTVNMKFRGRWGEAVTILVCILELPDWFASIQCKPDVQL